MYLNFKTFIHLIILCTALAFHLQASAQGVVTRQRVTPVIRTIPDSVTEKLKKEKEFLYANDPSYWQQDERKINNSISVLDRIARSPLFKWIIYILLAGVGVFIVYQVMVVNDFFIFSRSRQKKKSLLGEHEEIFTEKIDEKISNAIDCKEYRVAVRYLYLKTLQSLHHSKAIQLHADSTNRDYIKQMQQHAGINQFKTLTGIYEYVWYGKYHPSDLQFQAIKTNFNQFISSH